MSAQIEIHGHETVIGETAFAFLVLRLVSPVSRATLVEVIRHLAPVVPDADTFIEGLPDELDTPMQMLGIPWTVPQDDDELAAQRRVIEDAAARGVEAMWFFQTGTSLPADEDEDEDDDDADDADDEDDDGLDDVNDRRRRRRRR